MEQKRSFSTSYKDGTKKPSIRLAAFHCVTVLCVKLIARWEFRTRMVCEELPYRLHADLTEVEP
jgi:hypothetical protein